MKKLILLLSAILISVTFSYSQAPQAFKYQSVVRDATGEIIDNQLVSFRIGIRDVSAIGTLLYQETFTSTTNQFGLISVEIGNGTPTPASGIFTDIDWGTNSKFLEVELDPDGGDIYAPMGITQILSVPFAMYADTAGYGEDADWSFSGDHMYSAVPGNVGIGTQNPITPLHVQGRGAFGNTINSTKANRALNLIATDAVMRIWRTTDNSSFDPGVELIWGNQPSQGDDGNYWWDFFLRSSDGSFNIRDRSFGQGSSTRLTIDTSGFVGLGTSSPDERLHVAGAMVIEDMVTGSLSDSLVTWDPVSNKLNVIPLNSLNGDNDWTLDGDTLYSAADSTLTIKNGNVGIGTTNPDVPFVIMDGADTLFKIVDGQVRIGGNGPIQGIAFMGDAKSGVNGDPTNISNGLFRPAPNTQALATGNQERLRINPNGDIGIGTLVPQERLDVNGGVRIGFSANNNAGTIRWTGTEMEYNDGIQWNPFGASSPPPLWAENGPDIFNSNLGNVGIGTNTPTELLHVYESTGSSWLAKFEQTNPTAGGGILINVSDDQNGYSALSIGNDGNTLFKVSNSGNVAIGTNDPQYKLHVVDATGGSNLVQFEAAGEMNLRLTNPLKTWAIVSDNSPNVFRIRDVGNEDRFVIDENGNVGIGTIAPTQLLDINGKLRVRELLLHNGLSSVLVADSEGVLHVREVSTISGGGPWVESGSDIHNINAGNVGIGTSTPTHKLDVNGQARIEFMPMNNTLNNVVVADGSGVLYIRDAFTLGGFSDNIKVDENGNVGIGTDKPTAKAHIKDVLRLEPRNTYPSNPEEGDIFINANDHNIYCYLNGEWQQLNN